MLTFLNHLQMHCFPFLPLSFRMEVSEVSQFAVLVVGDGEGQVAASSFDDGARCLICLEPFREAEEGTELRQLPCQHIYCKECIDQWLLDSSVKCPELSCYWIIEKEEDKGGANSELPVQQQRVAEGERENGEDLEVEVATKDELHG